MQESLYAKSLYHINPEKASIEAGRFAFETTLATKSYTKTIKQAKNDGYQITLVFFWLASVELAVKRVNTRVLEGGHNIPQSVIINNMRKKDNPVRERIIKGMELTHKRLIKIKKDRNLDLVIYEQGKVVRIPAKDLKI